MTDFAVSVFRLQNSRKYWAPHINVQYTETDTRHSWYITCGGTRCYLLRAGDPLKRDLPNQAADSHFMVSRVVTGLLLGGAGLFKPMAMGRILFRDVEGSVKWDSQLDMPDIQAPRVPKRIRDMCADWIQSICGDKMLRRAADDIYLALAQPREAGIFIYRGLEWLKVGQKCSWEALAKDIGVTKNEMREFKKLANLDSGVRHASASGKKIRGDAHASAIWACSLFDALSAARARRDASYKQMTPKEIADVILRATEAEAYP